jgi:hypothetical protein
MRTDCDICNQTGVGPDGSYCRTQDCIWAEWRQLKDHNWEMGEICLAIKGDHARTYQTLTRVQLDLHELRYNFQLYGRHHRNCEKDPCTCGFAKVRIQGVRL